MTDEIALTLPRERPFFGVAHLVLGGIAARLDVTLEDLDDLQLALDGLLQAPTGRQDVTVRLSLDDERIHTVVGPFDGEVLRAELDREAAGAVGLARLLDTVVDSVDVVEREGAHWVELTKTIVREVDRGA